jgi:hypothetical protein
MLSRIAVITGSLVVQGLLAVSLSAQSPVETVHLVLTGGKNAGSFDAASARGGCSANATGPGSFGNQLSDPKGAPDKFNSLQLVVPSAKAAAAGTKEFQVIVGFGPLMKRTAEYEVNTLAATAKKAGSGTVTVTDKGATAKIVVDAVTKDGVKITATITCNSVTRM